MYESKLLFYRRAVDILTYLVLFALGVVWLCLFWCCSGPEVPPTDAGAYRDLDSGIDSPISRPDATVPRPTHDVTPVCADDAAGCNPEPAPWIPCGPPWCPGGNEPPNRNR